VNVEALVLAIVRGEKSPAALGEYGVRLAGQPGGWRLEEDADLPVVPVSVADLATGFIQEWARGSGLSEWAATVLMAACIGFPEDRSDTEDRLIDVLWDTSSGVPVTDEAVDLARHLARA
jgi:hypothetical protein